MKSSTLSSNGQNDTLKGSSCFSSRLYPLFILTLLLLGSTAMQAQADCVHIPENFVTSDPSCPDQPDNIAKLDRSISDEILYVKVSGDACCGEFLVNPKSGPDCYSDTIAGPSGPEVEFLEVGTVSDLCDLEGLDTCAEGNTELLLGCGNGMIGHRITFLGRIEDGTDSYWYYHVENNVDGCTSDISHFTFGIVDESVCCIDYDIDTSAVCENENSVFTVTPTGADNYLFFLDTNMNNVLDAGDEELQNSASNVYTDTDSSLNHGDAIGVVVTSADAQCSDTNIINAIIYDLPVVDAGDAEVCTGNSVQLSATPTGGTWSGDHISSSGLFNATGLTAGDYVVTYTYTDTNECTNSDTATVTVNPLPVVEADDASVCTGSSVQLTASPEGGTWSGDHVSSTGLFNATGLTAGDYSVTYTYTDTNECTNSDTATVTVNPLPVVEADNAEVCIGSSVQLTASPEGGTWSGDHVSSTGLFNATGLTAGDYSVTYTYTDDNECTNSDTATVTVDPLPVVEADNASVCIGSSIQLTASPEGGTWSGAHVNSSGLFNATGLTAGPYMVTYTYTDDNECTNSDTATVTVDPLPVVEADNASVCIGSSVQLSASPEGGTWSGDHVNSSGVFNAAGLTAGPYVVTYTYTDDNECTNSDTATVTVDPLPVVEADNASVCIGSSIQLTASPEGGTWSGAHVNSSGLFNATGLTAGPYMVTYTYTDDNECTNSDTATVTVDPLPIVEADNASVCIGSSIQLSASPEGGTWSGAHVNSSGVFNAEGLTAGPYVVTYTYTDDNECTNSDTATVTVDPLPVVEADNASVCIGSSIQLTASPEGGTWSGAHVNSSGLFNATGLTAGPYMVTYTYTDDNECTNSDTATVTVDPLPIVEADNASVCIGSSIQLTASPEGGTWSGDHVNSSGVFNAAGLTAGPYVVTYTYTDDNECTNSDTATVTVDPVPVVEADDASVCIGSSIQLTASPEGGTWSGAHVNSSGLFNATGLTAGNYVVTYTYTSGDDCVGSDTATVTVNPLPVVEADNASVCIGSSVQLSASPEGGTWSGDHVNSSGVFNAAGLTAGPYVVTYTYTDDNECTNSDTATVTVDPLPVVEADNASVCIGSSIQLTASPEGGTWSGAHVNSSGLFNATGLTAGPYMVTYTYTDDNECTNSDTATVTVDPLPIVEADNASVCIGSSIQLTASPEGGTWSGDHVNSSGVFNAAGLTAGPYVVTYTYTDDNECTNSDTATVTVDPVPVVEADDASVCIGSSIQLSASPEGGTWSGNHVSSTGLFNATGLTAGNYVVTYTYTSGDDCVGSDTATVTVNPLPVVEADNASVCIGSSVQLSASPEGGTWSGAHINSSGLFNATGLTAGDYMVTYTYTDTNNCTNSDTATVTVDPLPEVAADNAEVCTGSSIQLNASPEGGTWSGAHINSSGLFNATGLTAGPYVVTYTYTDTNNCTNSNTATVTVNPLPEVEAEDASLCIGSSVQLSASPEGGTWSGDHVSSSGLFNAEGLTAGNYMVTYTYTDINNCTNSDTATVTVDPVPVVEADDASVCIGSSIQLSASPEGGTWSGNHVSSTGLFNATGLTAGNYVVTYTYTSGDDCVNSDEAIVTVNDGPVLDIFLPPLDCFAEGGAIQVISDTEGLEFSLDGGPWFEYTGPVEDIAPGDHSLVARDAEILCQSIAEDFTIGPLLDSPITPVLDAIQPTCEEMTGIILVTSRTEGLQFFVILTSELPFVDPLFVDYPSGGFTNLAPGEYSVFAQSADNCVSGIATIVLNEPTDCFEGCTLGYWKNHTDRWCDTYQTCTLYGDVFEGAPDELAGLTLLEVLNQGGGGIYNLGRQSVAALLNACIGDITYALATPDDVIDYVTANFGNAGTAGEYLDMLNNAGCELGGSKATSASTCDDVVDGGNGNNGNGNNGNGNNGNNGNNGRDNSGKEDAKSASNVVAFPVPFKESLNLKYNLDYISDVIIEVFDMKGRHLRTYKDKNAGQGSESQLNVDFRLKANQVYVIKITTDRESFVHQVISSKK